MKLRSRLLLLGLAPFVIILLLSSLLLRDLLAEYQRFVVMVQSEEQFSAHYQLYRELRSACQNSNATTSASCRQWQAQRSTILQKLGQLTAAPTTRGYGKLFGHFAYLISIEDSLYDLLDSKRLDGNSAKSVAPWRELVRTLEFLYRPVIATGLAPMRAELIEFFSDPVRLSGSRADRLLEDLTNKIFMPTVTAYQSLSNEIHAIAQQQQKTLVLTVTSVFAALLLYFVLVLLYARRLVGVIEEIIKFTHHQTLHHDYVRPLSIESTDELGDLAKSLNQMATQRLAYQRELEEERRKFAVMANYTQDWEYWMDPQACFVWMSPSVETLTGYRAEEFYQNPALMEQLFQGDDATEMKHHQMQVQSSLHTSSECEFTARIFTKDHQVKWIQHRCVKIYDLAGNYLGVRANNRDVTLKRTLEAQLLHSERLAAVGTLAAGVAHEINNPLMVIRALNELLKKSFKDISFDKQGVSYFAKIEESVERCAKIVRSLKNYARSDVREEEINVDLHRVLAQSIDFCDPLFQKSGLFIQCEWLATQFIHPRIHSGQLQQILINLLHNAKDALESMGEGRILVSSKSYEENFELSVSDNGPGIEAKHLPHLFEPFFTTKPVGKGTGLGLAIVQNIVTTFNGRLLVESPSPILGDSTRAGTTFKIILPLKAPAQVTRLVFPERTTLKINKVS